MTFTDEQVRWIARQDRIKRKMSYRKLLRCAVNLFAAFAAFMSALTLEGYGEGIAYMLAGGLIVLAIFDLKEARRFRREIKRRHA